MSDSVRRSIDKALERMKVHEEQAEDWKKSIAAAEESLEVLNRSHQIIQKAAKMSQEHLASHLSVIVTQAIQAVIQKPYEFVCEFVERRGATEADLYLMKNGERFEILTGTGGGLADVISFTLKVAYLLLSNVDKVLIIDEVSRHVNSPEQRSAFATVLRRLSDQFEIQLILNTTIPELINIADNIITLRNVNDTTTII